MTGSLFETAEKYRDLARRTRELARSGDAERAAMLNEAAEDYEVIACAIEADAHVATGISNVARQRGIVAEMERDGHPATDERRVLKEFEDALALLVSRRHLLRVQLRDEFCEEWTG